MEHRRRSKPTASSLRDMDVEHSASQAVVDSKFHAVLNSKKERKRKRSPVAPFRCLAAMPPEGSKRAVILPSRPSLDTESRVAEVGFEPRTSRSENSTPTTWAISHIPPSLLNICSHISSRPVHKTTFITPGQLEILKFNISAPDECERRVAVVVGLLAFSKWRKAHPYVIRRGLSIHLRRAC
ncbi:hypothetical protein T265_03615 [Opisthorchis viverrini]|uniref:Uncharacterized protein n=1 Tax=Opisthorchis viverrini TaxID=6198 RepID=A0A074ZQX9_OPIVI|nr:hypothetical protein T265_03615 [Opisthorchis viverrini]KER29818.1 hypothetical protein T265_03615 [Opisthorchis viverrini]